MVITRSAEDATPRILVIDDEDDVRAVFDLALSRRGYEVVLHGDGATAVRAAAETDFRLAFVDIAMPGMDGVSVVRALREVSPSTHIVMITAFLDGALEPEDREDRVAQALALGARGCLRKPFGMDAIVKTAQYFAG